MGRTLALRTDRYINRDDGMIHPVDTARAYQQPLAQAVQWMKEHGHTKGQRNMTPKIARLYIA